MSDEEEWIARLRLLNLATDPAGLEVDELDSVQARHGDARRGLGPGFPVVLGKQENGLGGCSVGVDVAAQKRARTHLFHIGQFQENRAWVRFRARQSERLHLLECTVALNAERFARELVHRGVFHAALPTAASSANQGSSLTVPTIL